MTETPKFDPNKSYTWDPSGNFSFSGEEFGTILNTIRSIITTPEARRVLAASEAYDVLEGIISKGVESGIVVEVPTSPDEV